MTYRISTSLCAAALCLSSGAVLAQDADATKTPGNNAFADIDGRFYVSPMFSHTFASSRRDTHPGEGYEGMIGKQVNDYANLELYTFGTRFGAKPPNSGRTKEMGYGLGVMLSPFAPRSDFWGTWLGGGYGLIRFAYGNAKSTLSTLPREDGTRFVLDAGLGYLFRIPYFRFASLRLEANYRIDYGGNPFSQVSNDDNNDKPGFDDIVVSAGLVIPIGPRRVAAAPPEPPIAVAPVVEAPPPPPPPPKPECRKPAPGEKVTLDGCGTGDVIVLNGVNFDFNKATLTPNAKTILDQVSEELVSHPDIKVELAGHTDGKGSAPYNQKLSQKRAESVRKYFMDHGVTGDRMTAVGYGKTQPIDTNDTDEGRAHNRRVELRITASAGEVAQPVVVPTGSADSPISPAPAATDAPSAS